jgi:hypothetical protein
MQSTFAMFNHDVIALQPLNPTGKLTFRVLELQQPLQRSVIRSQLKLLAVQVLMEVLNALQRS